MSRPDPATRDAYLQRLGLAAEPPSVDALVRLHRAHVERVPYETVWIHTGDRWGVEAAESVARIAHTDRGGYCFHLNGAFAWLLDALGYDVVKHVGGVHGPGGPDPGALSNHLVLTVRGLDDVDWYVDAGLGDALHDPLPLAEGDHVQGPFRLRLARDHSGVADWHLAHDDDGSFTGMAWRAAPAEQREFAERHEWLSTSPESGFVKVLSLQRRDAGGVDKLTGLVLTRLGTGAATATIERADDLAAALGDVFGIDAGRLGPRFDDLWTRVRTAHEAWEAAGRP